MPPTNSASTNEPFDSASFGGLPTLLDDIGVRWCVAVDLLIVQTEYQSVALDRAAGHWLTVEDVLVHKLIAWRPRDRDDIAEILAAGISFDEGYVDRWSTAWEVTDRWREARGV